MLDIGGQQFTTTLTILTRFPKTIIRAMFSGRHGLRKDDAGAYFIDRYGLHFRHILNFLRSPEGCISNLELNLQEELKREANFYGLGDLMFPAVQLCPVKPMGILVTSAQGYHMTIKQDTQGMWLMEIRNMPNKPKVVNFRLHYKGGWTSNYYYGVQTINTFNKRFEILPCQPQAPYYMCRNS
jgi:hypothetical protein